MKPLLYCLLPILSYFSMPVTAQTLSTPLVRKNVAVQAFSALSIQGPVNVTIDTSQTNPSIPPLQIFGDPKTVSAVTWKIKNHTLYLDTKWTYRPHRGDKLTIKVNTTPSQLSQIDFNSNGRLFGQGLTGSLSLISRGNGSINLSTNKLNLKSLVSHGESNISLYHVNSTDLSIQGKNSGKIKIEGDVALHTINLTGNGTLLVHWVNSPYLKINASGNEKIFLAGVTKTLDMHLSEKSHLFAKQLRAENGFVETKNQANAKVSVKQKLSALAQDNSTIYYSKPVEFLNTFTKNTGLVLSN
ncbi:GIN domain-containing protein [Rickettsiella endosymbiont of Dermanyssus gallinae]|uniref:GIN domain-containing protein n=1 Tax=Rickettsiella endosymbiont of Dermanyssus gallinae TaxID=2856608 RepID=UPI001C52BEF8|nr:DUF2807 domain-containing protein [Rickettsiella endosymbiont of Dermanyssus gallinae]